MNNLLKNHINYIEELSDQFRVNKLYAFGSVLSNNFEQESDVDFLVSFKRNIPLGDFADNYFDLHNKLESILGKKVDLVIEKSIQNPFLVRSINNFKKLIYDKGGKKVSI
jgi:predicted nucleotidyltransferase